MRQLAKTASSGWLARDPRADFRDPTAPAGRVRIYAVLMAPDPSMRASDSDRENVVASLREHTVAGRLTQDEFEERMRAAYGAKTYGELAELTKDLPIELGRRGDAGAAGPVDLSAYNTQPARANWMRNGPVAGFGGVFAINTLIWAIVCASSGHLIYFWPVWLLIPLALGVMRGLRHGHAHGPDRVDRHQARAEMHARRHEVRDGLRDARRELRDDLRRARRERW